MCKCIEFCSKQFLKEPVKITGNERNCSSISSNSIQERNTSLTSLLKQRCSKISKDSKITGEEIYNFFTPESTV